MAGANFYFRGIKDDKKRAEILELLYQLDIINLDNYNSDNPDLMYFTNPDLMYFTYDRDDEKFIGCGTFWPLWQVLENNPHPNYKNLVKMQKPLYKKVIGLIIKIH